MSDFEALADRLAARHGLSILILAGSFARGDAGPASDIDMLAFREAAESFHDHSEVEGHPLDCFIKPLSALDGPVESLLYLRGGRLLRDDGRRRGAAFLAKLEAAWAEPVEPLGANEIGRRRAWHAKTAARALAPDAGPEGHFRRLVLLEQALYDAYDFLARRYPGSKAAFAELPAFAPEFARAYARAVAPGAPEADLRGMLAELDRLALRALGDREAPAPAP